MSEPDAGRTTGESNIDVGTLPKMAEERETFLGAPISWWDGVSGLVTLLAILPAMLGIGFGFFEYRSRIEAAQAKETLELIDVWETRGAYEAYRRLQRQVEHFLDSVPEVDLKAAESDEVAAVNLYRKISQTILVSVESEDDFYTVIYFFERLGLCIDSGLCSEGTARIFFDSAISSFGRTFSDRILKQRNTQPNFAKTIL